MDILDDHTEPYPLSPERAAYWANRLKTDPLPDDDTNEIEDCPLTRGQAK